MDVTPPVVALAQREPKKATDFDRKFAWSCKFNF